MKRIILDSSLAQGGTRNAPTFRFLKGIQMIGIRLSTMVLPLSFYNVRDSTNTIKFVDGGQTRTAIIPVGQYSEATLVDALKTALTSAGTQTYTTVFNRSTGKIQVTAPGNFRFLTSGSTVNDILGLTKDGTLATSYTFDKPIDLSGIKMILISCPQVTTDSVVYSGREDLNILDHVPILQDLGTVQVYQNAGELFIDTMDQIISEMTIRLIDSKTLEEVDLLGSSFQLIMDVL